MFGHLRAINVEEVCRICLKDLDENAVNIFAAPYNDGEALASEIERVFYIKIVKDEGKSTTICQKCYALVIYIQGFTEETKLCNEVTNILYESTLATGFKTQILHLPLGSHLNFPESEIIPSESNMPPAQYKFSIFCPFCKSGYNEYIHSSRVNLRIKFCTKHCSPYSCLVPNCHIVFPSLDIFILHYKFHLDLPINDSVCHTCFEHLDSSKVFSNTEHKHQDLSKLMVCCNEKFSMMNDFTNHKLKQHSAIVSMIHLEISTDAQPNIPVFINQCSKDELKKCLIQKNMPDSSSIYRSDIYSSPKGSYNCKICNHECFSVLEFVEHLSKIHKSVLPLKESGIKLCPLCDKNYSIGNYDEHITKCTNTMRITNNSSLIRYGCVFCHGVFEDIAPKLFRCHYLYCKSFNLISHKGKDIESCINCNFTTLDKNASLLHANSRCIHLQLKMRYAMKPIQNEKVEKKIISDDDDDNVEDYYGINSKSVKHQFNLVSTKTFPIDGTQDVRKVKLYCYPTIQKDIGDYNYLCNNCNGTFYSDPVFQQHLLDTGEKCRPITLWYCHYCHTDFSDSTDFERHLTEQITIEPSDSSVIIKNEELKIVKGEPLIDPFETSDYGDNNIVDDPTIFDSERLSVILQFQEPGPSRQPGFNEVEPSFQEFDDSNDHEPDCDIANSPDFDWN